MAAVRIFLCRVHHAGTNRVKMNIADKLAEILLTLAKDRFVAPLKDVSHSSVSPIIILAVTGQKPLHCPSDRLGLTLDQQMNVIAHRTISV